MQPRLRYWARHLYGTQPYLQIANLFTRVAREVVLTVMSIENLLTNDNLQTIYRKLQRTPTIAIAWIRPLSSIASCLSIPKIFLELPRNFIEYFEVTQRSLRVFYVHLMFTKKRKSTYRIFVSAWFSAWTSQGLNLGPPDYESVALTNWATSPGIGISP